MVWNLAEEPPADRLIQIYFRGNKWWEPPSRTAFADGAAEDDPEIWESALPDVTD